MEYTTTLPPSPPRALSASLLPAAQALPPTTTSPIPSHLPPLPLPTPLPPPEPAHPNITVEPLGANGSATHLSDSDRVQAWLAQQSELGIEFARAEGVRPEDEEEEEGEEEGAFGAEEYVGYTGYGIVEEKGFSEQVEVVTTTEEEEAAVGEVVQRLGLGGEEEEEWTRRGRFQAEEWKEEEGRRIPGAPDAHPHLRSPVSSTESSSRADSPVLGFPSSESLLLLPPMSPMGPALRRGLSGSLSGRSAFADTADVLTGLAGADASGEGVVDPLRRPGRHYVRALPEGEETVLEEKARVGAGAGLDVDEEAEAYEAAFAYVDAGGVVAEDGVGRDKPLPGLPSRSPSASPPPAAEAGSALGGESGPSASALQQRRSPQGEAQPLLPPSLSRSQSRSRAQSRSQSRRNSVVVQPSLPTMATTAAAYAHAPSPSQSSYLQGGVAASARQAQFSIGPGAPAVSRRASQALLGVGGAGAASVPVSRGPSLSRMPSLPLLGESVEGGVEAERSPAVEPQQYHLPLGMQVRRARSTVLLAPASGETSPSRSPAAEEAGGVSMSSSLSSLSLLQPPAPTSPSTANIPQQPSPSPLIQSSPLPPSAPPTRRSRAGSLGAAMALSPYNYQGPGLHSHAPSAENVSMSGIRDAVYIDSAEVRARLDRLLAGLEDGEGLGAEDAGRGAEESGGEGVQAAEVGEGEDEDEDEGLDYTLTSFPLVPVDDDVDPDAANALRTPPSSARVGVYRQSTVTARAPPNTPMTPSYAAPSYVLAQQSPHPQDEHQQQHKAQRSHASLHSVRSAGSRGSSLSSSAHGSRGGSKGSLSVSLSSSGSLKRLQQQQQQQYPYQHAQASGSQVYVGPGLAAAAVGGGHARTPSAQQPQHARGASGGSSGKRHSRAPSQGPAQQQANSRSRASSVAHSRAPSHSRSSAAAAPGQAHSRTSSAAHSRAGSVVLLAQTPPTPPMHIPVPVPVPVRAGAVSGVRPMRPPPAPPLDVAALELGLGGVRPEVGLEGRGEVMGVDDAEEAMVVGNREEEEEEETSEDERERLQFLRGLGLEDRMKEFKGVEFPSSLDDHGDDGAVLGAERLRMEYDNGHDGGKFGAEQSEFLASHPQLVNEGMLAVTSDGPGDQVLPVAPPEIQRSMSRWSLGSSTMDEPLEDPSVGAGKKERKRKSFATPFGLGSGSSGDAVDSSALSASAGTSSPTGTGSGKEKKRGRLASFISRLSGVGVNGTLPSTPISSPLPPPLPTSPTSPSAPPGLLPSPLIIEASLRKMQSKESVVAVVAGAWEPRPLQHSWEYQAPKPKKQPQQKKPSSPALSKSVPSSPSGRVRNPPLPLPQANVGANANGSGVGKSASAQDVLGGSLSAATGRKLAGRMVAWEASTTGDALERNEKTTAAAMPMGLRARANTSGDLLLLADSMRRPALYKSASASVLGPSGVQRTPLGQGHRRTPVPIHTGMSPYHGGPTVVVDDSLPPTPSSLASTEIDEEDEEDDEEEEDYGVEVDESSRARREQEHEERWTRLKMANDAVAEGYRPYQQQALPPIPQSPPPPPPAHSSSVALIESTLKALAPSPSTTNLAAQQGLQPASSDTRQRLKSMPSLTLAPAPQAVATAATSPPASASTTNFAPAPSIMSARSGKGFRGFVERMGLGGSSANSINSSPSSSYPGTPLYAVTPLSSVPLQLSIPGSGATVLGQFVPSPSTAGNNNRSPSHSPTTSLSLGGAHKEGGVFTPGGLLGKKKPKRKLVISGVAPENVKGYEAVKRWCEAFGEVREMTRASNGKLYVDFKKASVAETVCRIQAQVFIKGAGSVSLSWYTKKIPL